MIVELPDDEDVEIAEECGWVPLWQIKHLFDKDAWANPHLIWLSSLIGP